MASTRARTITRIGFAVLVAGLLAAAAVFARTEFVTVAMLIGVIGIADDLRRTQRIAGARP